MFAPFSKPVQNPAGILAPTAATLVPVTTDSPRHLHSPLHAPHLYSHFTGKSQREPLTSTSDNALLKAPTPRRPTPCINPKGFSVADRAPHGLSPPLSPLTLLQHTGCYIFSQSCQEHTCPRTFAPSTWQLCHHQPLIYALGAPFQHSGLFSNVGPYTKPLAPCLAASECTQLASVLKGFQGRAWKEIGRQSTSPKENPTGCGAQLWQDGAQPWQRADSRRGPHGRSHLSPCHHPTHHCCRLPLATPSTREPGCAGQRVTETEGGGRWRCAHTLAPSLTSCVSLGQFLSLSVPQFPLL